MLKIGITGGIGSGKSIVCKVFTLLGVPVYHADDRAKNLIETNRNVRSEIISLLGENAFIENNYNPKFVGSLVFKSKSLLLQLNNIVHPYVASDFTSWYSQFSHLPYVIEEAAILFESGANKNMDANILVDAPENLRIERVMKRNSMTKNEVIGRIHNQHSTDKIRHLVDYIIVNNDKKLILPQILNIHNSINTLALQ